MKKIARKISQIMVFRVSGSEFGICIKLVGTKGYIQVPVLIVALNTMLIYVGLTCPIAAFILIIEDGGKTTDYSYKLRMSNS